MIRFLLLSLMLTGCAGSSGGGSSSAGSTVVGYDYSGSYHSSEIECYSSDLSTLHTQASITTGIEYITITGNNWTSYTNDFGCLVSYSGTIQFTAAGVTMTNRKVTGASGGSCTSQFVLSNSPAHTVTPTSASNVRTTGDTLPNVTNASYIRNTGTGATGLLSTYANSASPSDYCLLIYIK